MQTKEVNKSNADRPVDMVKRAWCLATYVIIAKPSIAVGGSYIPKAKINLKYLRGAFGWSRSLK